MNHCCPVKLKGESLKAMNGKGIRATRGVSDLNSEVAIRQNSKLLLGGCHEHRQDAVRPDHGLSAVEDISSNCRAAWRQQRRSDADVRRAVSGDGLCATDLPGESARCRSLPSGSGGEVVSHGLSRTGGEIDAGRCQRVPRLAHLGKFRGAIDCSRARAVSQRGLGTRPDEHGVCAGYFHGRTSAPPRRR